MINTPYFNSEEIESIINNPEDLSKYFRNSNVVNEETFGVSMLNSPAAEEDYEGEEEYEDEEGYESENDVESMTDKEKIKLAYEILSMTAYEDEFFMGILGRLRKLMRK